MHEHVWGARTRSFVVWRCICEDDGAVYKDVAKLNMHRGISICNTTQKYRLIAQFIGMKSVNSAMCIFLLLLKRITILDQSILAVLAPSRHHAHPPQCLQSNLLIDVTYNPSHTLPFSTVHFPSTFSSPVCTLTPYSPCSNLQTLSLSSQKLPAY
jgi:hypothetical protein